jgi:ribosomal-protein-serine acetyltransferase
VSDRPPVIGRAFEGPVGDGVTLAPLALSDADQLFAITDASRDHLRPWMPWIGAVASPGDTREFIRSVVDQRQRNDGYQCAIRVDGAMAGIVGHHRIDWPNRLTSIGYWLAADHQGKGIMTRCCSALIDFAFEELALNRVEISAAVENRRSLAVIERLGFLPEGHRREAEWVHGRFVDLKCYAVLRSEWDATALG